MRCGTVGLGLALLSSALGCSGEGQPGAIDQRGAPVFAGTGGGDGLTGGTGGVITAGSGGSMGGTGGDAQGGTGGDGSPDAGLLTDAGSDAAIDAGLEPEPEPMCELPPPEEFMPNADVGGGGALVEESDHFRIYGNAADPATALNHLEAAHQCFVEDWCFRSPGLSVHDDDTGPYYKLNVYGVSSLGGAAGVMRYDDDAGLAFLEVLTNSVPNPRTVVHEFGHALTMTEFKWANQGRTGAWWETVANWVSDSYLTSVHCEAARSAHGVAQGQSIINLDRVIEQSHLLIVSEQNFYEAWPFLTYLTMNPDRYPGLGRMAVADLMRNHAGNNETPLHVLERIAMPVKAQTILGRYWARMAFLDIGHPVAQQKFLAERGGLDFAILDAMGGDTYRVKAARRPAYGGANIIPLDASGAVSVQVTNLGNGQADSNFTATLAMRTGAGVTRYVDLPDGAGQATVASDEEATLVVVNTPDALYQYNAFDTTATSPEAIGLDYEVEIKGAVPTE